MKINVPVRHQQSGTQRADQIHFCPYAFPYLNDTGFLHHLPGFLLISMCNTENVHFLSF